MDLKCIRILRPYDDEENDKMVLHIDDQTRQSLSAKWGDMVEILGKRTAAAQIQPLKKLDEDGFIGRAGTKLIDELYIEYGEEVLLNHKLSK